MTFSNIDEWINQHSHPGRIWYVKRLSGNDTLATGAHQAGPYIPKEILFSVFPSINNIVVKNPDVWFELFVDSHQQNRNVRAVYYNNKFHKQSGRGRNETRITNLVGASSELLSPENTGALAVFIFVLEAEDKAATCRVWICRNEHEESVVEDLVGVVEPGQTMVWPHLETSEHQRLTSVVVRSLKDKFKIPDEWVEVFPSPNVLFEKSVQLEHDLELSIDERLVRRRECEHEIFRFVEEASVLPQVQNGFSNIEEFLSVAQTVLQRRKVRSGRSLELHVKQLLIEENLIENSHFSYQPKLIDKTKPDFIFPSEEAYNNEKFSSQNLRVLAVKSTIRDRWRQVLEEAKRVSTKHLLTVQEGVSKDQFQQITEANVRLVVPKPIHSKYPKEVRSGLMTLQDFIDEVESL